MEQTIEQRAGGLSSFQLKIIAIIGMTLDHIGIVFGEYLTLPAKTALYALGGLTFPIMACLLVEGYKHTSNFKKYALRLLGFAVITQIPYYWALMHQGNILFTLLLGLMIIYLYDHMQSRVLFYVIFVACTILSIFLDWGLIGVPMVLCYHTIKGKWKRLIFPALLPCLCMALPGIISILFGNNLEMLPNVVYCLVGCTLTIPLLNAYNGKQGKRLKYLFYIYYPAHIALLGLLRGLIFKVWK